ncbi:MAG: hypothetical protein ACI9KE_005313, partial [Polyangiales bacterium]
PKAFTQGRFSTERMVAQIAPLCTPEPHPKNLEICAGWIW